MEVACWLYSMQPFIAYANVYRLWQAIWSEEVREERFSRRRASADRHRRKEKPMNKFTQGFAKQANLTCSLTRCREYVRKKCAAMSMLEREEILSRRMEHDKVRRPMKIGGKGLAC